MLKTTTGPKQARTPIDQTRDDHTRDDHTRDNHTRDNQSQDTHRFCIAPMLDWSDRHCRFFWRLLSKRARLYTEMVTTGALLNGDKNQHLKFSSVEKPLALQLGGSNPQDLATCAAMAEDWGYDEVNLNCGCPSDRVQTGKIGAILMGEPGLVAECISAMKAACSIPVTLKHRIGIDDMDDYKHMEEFVSLCAQAGCDTFIVHARKAWLKGLSPKENRQVPPLKYERIFQLKQQFPQLNIIINGGITSLAQSQSLLQNLDGVMIGREAYHNPWMLAQVDQLLFAQEGAPTTRDEVATALCRYIEDETAKGTRLHHISRHTLGLYNSLPGARKFRRHLSENAVKNTANHETFLQAVSYISTEERI